MAIKKTDYSEGVYERVRLFGIECLINSTPILVTTIPKNFHIYYVYNFRDKMYVVDKSNRPRHFYESLMMVICYKKINYIFHEMEIIPKDLVMSSTIIDDINKWYSEMVEADKAQEKKEHDDGIDLSISRRYNGIENYKEIPISSNGVNVNVLFTPYVINIYPENTFRYFVTKSFYLSIDFYGVGRHYGTIISSVPIDLDHCKIDDKVFASDEATIVSASRVQSWLFKHNMGIIFRDKEIEDEVNVIIKSFSYSKDDNDCVRKYFKDNSFVFAKLLKDKMNCGFVGVLGRSSRCVWVDPATGHCFGSYGKVDNSSYNIVIAIDGREINSDILLNKELIPYEKYLRIEKYNSDKFPNK